MVCHKERSKSKISEIRPFRTILRGVKTPERLAQLLRTHGALAGSPSTGVRCLEGVKEVVINAVTCKARMRAFGAHESTIRHATSLSVEHTVSRVRGAVCVVTISGLKVLNKLLSQEKSSCFGA